MVYNMKTITTTLCLFILLFIFKAKAGENKFGIKAGPNYMCPYFEHYTAKIGCQVGIYSNLQLYKFISLQAEILFAKKEYEYLYKNSWEQKTRAHYVDLPVFVQFYKLKPVSIYGGGQISLMGKHHSLFNTENSLIREKYPPDDVSLALLCGIMIKPIKHFGMDFRYSIAFESSDKVQNFRGWQFFINYEF